MCFCNTQSQSGLGEESGLSRPSALRDGEPRRLLSDPILPSREGSRAPPTCKHRRAVGIADVGVRGVDVLGVEDEDPQHDWRGVRAQCAQGAERAGEGRGRSRRSSWVPSLERAGGGRTAWITGSRLRAAALKEEQASPGLLQWAPLGPRPGCAQPACQRVLRGEQGLLLTFHPRRPTRARLSCNSMLRPQTLPMTRHFAPGGGTADWAAAARAEGWTRGPGAQRSSHLAPAREKGFVPPLTFHLRQCAQRRARRLLPPQGFQHSPSEPAGRTAPGTRWGAGAGPALSREKTRAEEFH